MNDEHKRRDEETFRRLMEHLGEQMRLLRSDNNRMREALERISRERTTQPRGYADLVLGSGVDVPTRAAMIASDALEVLQ